MEKLSYIFTYYVMVRALSASEREIRSFVIDSMIGMVEPMRKRR